MNKHFLNRCLAGFCTRIGLDTGFAQAQDYRLASPDGKLNISIYTGDQLQWAIRHDGTEVLQPSDIGLQGRDEKSPGKGITFGRNVRVSKATRRTVDTSFPTPSMLSLT